MDYSPFYYTYSTISQTLAGAFGFLGAVVLFRMQAIEAPMSKLAHVASMKTTDASNAFLLSYMRAGDWAAVVRTIETLGFEPSAHVSSQLGTPEECLVELKARVKQMDTMKKALGTSLIGTVGTIVLCLILMPLTNKDTRFGHPTMAWPVLGLVVLFAITTLASFYPLVQDMVKFENK